MEHLGIKNDINVEKPEYSYTAHVLLDAYNIIARGRRYADGITPLHLDDSHILRFIELHDCPIDDIDTFCYVMFSIDNEYIDEVREEAKKKVG